ncbi:30S ribosomal protein S7 [Candidatus Uhrbacteria bacterium]|nr:30S ribosomal protein S7 [Candidatus Uhrbacteria bacterium]
MRHKLVSKRKLAPDPKYGNLVLAKFINTIMRKGKKTTAQKVVYGALDQLRAKAEQAKEAVTDPVLLFEAAMKNVSPLVEVRSKRIGGSNYQIPIPVRTERRTALAFRWLITAAREKKGKPMAEKLATELFDAIHQTGAAIKKKQDVHRMAEANRAFAHFAR